MTYEQALRAVEHVRECLQRCVLAPPTMRDEIKSARESLVALEAGLQQGLTQNAPEQQDAP